MSIRWTSILALSLLLSASLPACSDERARAEVVTTTGMIADLAREIAGDRLQVEALMGPDIDPHLFSPTRSDVARLQGAKLVLCNGLHLEGRMLDTLDSLAEDGVEVVAVGEALPQDAILRDPERGEHPDPHVWMDAELWAHATAVIAEALTRVDPDGAEHFRARAEALAGELRELHRWGRQQVARVPESRRVLVTSHDAFRYFGRAYGLEVHGIQGISTESAAGLADVNRLVELVVRREVPAVFAESSVPAKSVEALREGARARGFELALGGELYSDAMGPEGTPEGSCLGMLEHNLRTVCQALGATVEPRSAPAADDGGEG